MVALAVPRFGFQPKLCLARPMLLEALDRYEKADYLGAGVRLRESVRRLLVAAIEWYGVPLTKAMQRDKFARTTTLAKALRDAKLLDEWGYEIILECLAVGNAAAHCRPFCKRALKGGISLLFGMIDSEPYSALKERQPVAATFDDDDSDDDDDDHGDDWKLGIGGAL